MKDLKAYIESGVLELYVLGDLSAQERHQVELDLKRYPELVNELKEIENSLQIYAEKHAIEPPEYVRENILNSLSFADETSGHIKPLSQPAAGANFYKYAFAASVALLVVSAGALIKLNSQLDASNQRIAVLETSNQKFSSRVNYINNELINTKQTLDVYQHAKDYRMVELKGVSKAPAAKLVVAFNAAKETVMIDLASMEMPENDEQHQYQLWALVDGKPVDLGVFDKKSDSTGMIKMKPIKNAQAFAVTLEPRGGNASPTMDQMIVMGSI